MRTMMAWAALFVLSACIDEVTDSACDEYVDYLCACGVDSCQALGDQFDPNDLAVQDQCRIDLACFEDADAENGATCSIVGTDDESQCLAE